MKKIKVITVIGARPQFIKAGAVSRAIKDYNDNGRIQIEEILIHTGQHFDKDMSDVFFEELSLAKPKYNLGISSLSHGAMTGRMIEELEVKFILEKPDCILVYGDTNSTLATAIAGSKLHIPIAHIEAGLRSFNNRMPEEINRILTDRVSKLLFCPTQKGYDNLINEGFKNFDTSFCLSGDVMFDQALFYKNKARKPQLDLGDDFIVSTIHRPETTNYPHLLEQTLKSLSEIGKKENVLLVLHPGTKKKIENYKIDMSQLNITTIPPLSYLEICYLLDNCKMVITDSGGLQKEAFFFGKYCIVLRNETEWTEIVAAGFNFVCGNDHEKIISAYQKIIAKKPFNPLDYPFYGRGDASKMIVEKIANLV